MKPFLALPLAMALASPALAASSETRLCMALQTLRHEAERAHRPLGIVFIKAEAMSSACSRDPTNVAQRQFCEAALNAVGIEFTHAFPWMIYDCLMARNIRPIAETSVQYTGMVAHPRRLIHLAAAWPNGTRIDIRFLADGDFGPQPEFQGYWGRYEMIVTGARDRPAPVSPLRPAPPDPRSSAPPRDPAHP